MQNKVCSECKISKEFIHFNKDSHSKLGIRHACRECEVKIRKKSYIRNRKKRIAGVIAWKKKNMAYHLAHMKSYRKALKRKVIEGYGGECVCCGETEIVFLTIDHVNRDGHLHRQRNGGGHMIYRELIKEKFPSYCRVLCMNCNFAIRFGNICPHQALAKAGVKP